MDIGRSFSAPFKDSEWVQKVGLGGLWGLLVVTSPAQTGYQLDYIRGVAQGDERLPTWSDFGNLWVKGLLATIGLFIYMLPAIILYTIAFIPIFIAAVSGSDSDAAAAAGFGSLCLFGTIAFIWIVVVSIFALAGIANYAMTGRFGSMFAFGEIMAKVKTPGYFTAWGMNLVVLFVAGTVVSMLSATGVGGILAPWVYFPAYLISGHLIGQWASGAYGTSGLSAMAPASYPATAGAAPTGYPAPLAPPAPPVAPMAPAAPGAYPPPPPAQPPAAVPSPPAPPAPPMTPVVPVEAPVVAPAEAPVVAPVEAPVVAPVEIPVTEVAPAAPEAPPTPSADPAEPAEPETEG